jgi:hypothetical protein
MLELFWATVLPGVSLGFFVSTDLSANLKLSELNIFLGGYGHINEKSTQAVPWPIFFPGQFGH